jgi:hypothetical protein
MKWNRDDGFIGRKLARNPLLRSARGEIECWTVKFGEDALSGQLAGRALAVHIGHPA